MLAAAFGALVVGLRGLDGGRDVEREAWKDERVEGGGGRRRRREVMRQKEKWIFMRAAGR